jgi:AraC family transcriptional regulator, transcriptional activator of pobA
MLQYIPEFTLSEASVKGVATINLEEARPTDNEHATELPHRDDHYMLVVLNEGSLNADIDFERHVYTAPCVLLVQPGQVHQLSPQTALKGWSVSFDAAVLGDDDALKAAISGRHIDIPATALEQINSLLEIINKAYSKARPSLLAGLLYIIAGNNSSAKEEGKKSRPLQLKQQFIQLLYEHYKDWKKPSTYAEQLHVTTSHLNDTIKHITGRSVTVAIQEHCVLEAQRLLRYTTLSVNEICYELGFQNPSHFIKIFKTVAGCTPLQYRQQA